MAATKRETRRPDLTLKVRAPDGRSGVIGAGWICEDGSVSIKLDACVVLAERDGWMIKLFPKEFQPKATEGQDDETPF